MAVWAHHLFHAAILEISNTPPLLTTATREVVQIFQANISFNHGDFLVNHKLQTILDRMTNAPSSDWDGLVPQLNTSERVEIAKHLDDCIQIYCRLVEYLEVRGAAGCGDNGHDDAIERAKKQLKKVRKALGYTYP